MIIFMISWASIVSIIGYVAYRKYKKDEEEMEKFWDSYQKYKRKINPEKRNPYVSKTGPIVKLKEGTTKSNVKTQLPSNPPSKPPKGLKNQDKGELFKSFETYYLAHENQRFWQALRNWSGYGFIGYSIDGKEFRDLFYKEGR